MGEKLENHFSRHLPQQQLKQITYISFYTSQHETSFATANAPLPQTAVAAVNSSVWRHAASTREANKCKKKETQKVNFLSAYKYHLVLMFCFVLLLQHFVFCCCYCGSQWAGCPAVWLSGCLQMQRQVAVRRWRCLRYGK